MQMENQISTSLKNYLQVCSLWHFRHTLIFWTPKDGGNALTWCGKHGTCSKSYLSCRSSIISWALLVYLAHYIKYKDDTRDSGMFSEPQCQSKQWARCLIYGLRTAILSPVGLEVVLRSYLISKAEYFLRFSDLSKIYYVHQLKYISYACLRLWTLLW